MGNELKQIRESIDGSFNVVRDALGGKVLPLCYALRDLGKRCSERWIYNQSERSDIRRLNFLANYKLWKGAFILSGNRMGAELINNDVEIFERLCWNVGNGMQKPRLETDKKLVNLITRILCDTRTLKEMLVV